MAASKTALAQHKWWKEAIIYQIYPASFKDSNGDGWGDIKGITSKVDYLKELGVDVVWTSPIYKSPMADYGYDISDYKQIDPSFGTIEDVDELIAELKKRDMKLMMDLVVNHTSNQHEWFLESAKSRDNPKRDWYIWKDSRGRAEDGTPLPPNNWAQIFDSEHSAWNYDKTTDQWYLGIFTPEQPDLQWENREVREAVHDVMNFWLDRGVCGYRMDVINFISKVPSYPDVEPVDGKYHGAIQYYANGPRMHEYLQEIYKKVLEPHGAITVGEMPGISDVDEVLRSVGANSGELNMIFIFDIVDIDNEAGKGRLSTKPFGAKDIRQILTKWQNAMIEKDGWNSVFIENHDNPRSVGRYVDDSDEYHTYGAKLLALLQSTLAGTLFVYEGEELGQRNIKPGLSIEDEYKDIETINYWRIAQSNYGKNGKTPDATKLAHDRDVIERMARDHSRTPVQWDSSANAGFCDANVTPWMHAVGDYKEINAERQMSSDGKDEPGGMSVFRFWQRALADRKKHKDVFIYGDFELIGEVDDESSIFAYTRTGKQEGKWLVVLNFSGQEVSWDMPKHVKMEMWCAGNYAAGRPEKPMAGSLTLKAWEGVLGRCA